MDTDSRDRDTPVTFSKEESELIRQMVVAPGADVTCPRCDTALESEVIAGGGSIQSVWELKCSECRRTMIVRDLPH